MIEHVQPLIAEALGDAVALTTALPGLLEVCGAELQNSCQESSLSQLACQVLPPGASKGTGVARLLKLVGIAPENTIALGDGENDLECASICCWCKSWYGVNQASACAE